MSYQREDERYWTDYLRVALPIVGLLLLVGLLWFWLASIIGDDNDEEPTPTPNTATTVIAAATSTATTSGVIEITPTTGAPVGQPTATQGGEQPPPTDTPGEGGEPTEEPAEEARFAEGDVVLTNDPGVRLRSSPSSATEDNILVEELPEGAELVIAGPSEVGDDDLVWWPVDYPDGDITGGYVADQFVEPEE